MFIYLINILNWSKKYKQMRNEIHKLKMHISYLPFRCRAQLWYMLIGQWWSKSFLWAQIEVAGYHKHNKLGSHQEEGFQCCDGEDGKTEMWLLSLTDQLRPTEWYQYRYFNSNAYNWQVISIENEKRSLFLCNSTVKYYFLCNKDFVWILIRSLHKTRKYIKTE